MPKEVRRDKNNLRPDITLKKKLYVLFIYFNPYDSFDAGVNA
jgi:hypothetical protein